MSEYQHIRFEIFEGVATLTLARPAKMNALAPQTLTEMLAALDRVDGHREIRALLITAEGRAFCSGADLGSVSDDPAAAQDMGAGLEAYYNPLVEKLRALPVPVVAAVNGAAAGGGCGLALAADIVIAARSAYFLQPFANIGLVPDVGATWLLPRLVGKARATAMMILGERIGAEQAVAWGMIYQMVEDADLMQAARALAARLATGPTISYRLMRQAITNGLETGLSETLAEERRNQKAAGLTDDHRAAVIAFLEKRKPVFEGR